MIEAISPRPTEIETSSTARTPPNRFDTAVAASSTSPGMISSDAPAARVVALSAILLAFLLPSRCSCTAVMAGMMLTQTR